jgi:hypothetical protein
MDESRVVLRLNFFHIATALFLIISITLINSSSVSASAGPTVTSVTSSLPDGSYTTGQVIPVQVIFSDVVNVTGTPQLILSTGSPNRTTVNYSSGSGSTTLTFIYTVASGNASPDLDYVNGNPLILNNGTITDATANNADLKLPNPGSPGSLGANKNIIIDTTPPSVTINQAVGQPDPTNASSINFTVVFSEVVTDFVSGDVSLGGTAGATTATVTGGPITYTVAVSGMTTSGTVIASITPGVAHDAAGNPNTASISTDNSVTYDITPPTVTIDQAATQIDPTNTSPINFTVVFSETTTDFATGDVSLSGTALPTVATVTGSGTTYNVAVSGMTANGTVIASIPAGVAKDIAGNPNIASTSTDNSVTYTGAGLSVTINQATTQADPTNASPINFTVVFSEVTTDFANGDVTLSGTAGATTAIVTGSGTTYDVSVTGMAASGTVIASIAAGVAHDTTGNPNTASTSTDNSVTYDITPLIVSIDQAATQVDPTNTSPINFTVVFSKETTDFTTGDVALSGTAGATTAAITGGGTTYTVAVTGMANSGTVIASIPAGVAHDAAGNRNATSTSTDNAVTYNAPELLVMINQAASQADPTNVSPINFTVEFSESTTDFATGDVTLSGTAVATTATVTGSGTTYNVAVSGMTTNGSVIATIPAGVAHDIAGNPNAASTSTDNSVTYTGAGLTVTINQAATQADPTNASPISFTVIFSAATTDFATGDVTLGGTAGATTAIVSGSGTTYDVAVSGMSTTTSGTVIATISAGVAHDSTGNSNMAAISTDNSVTYDKTWPSLSWISPPPCGNPPGCIYYVINQSISLTVDASDIVGIASVDFRRWDYVNNIWIGIGTLSNPPYGNSPYSITLNTSGLLPEWNQINVKAYDAANNASESWIFLYHTPVWRFYLPLIIR